MSKKVQLKVSINRSSGWDEAHPIRFEINDATSHCRVLEFKMSLEDFARAVTGLSYVPAFGEVFDDNPIGCTSEHKEELVPRPRSYGKDKAKAAELLAPFEVDGWKARNDDIFNPHRWVGDDRVAVSFTRYINPDGSVWKRNV